MIDTYRTKGGGRNRARRTRRAERKARRYPLLAAARMIAPRVAPKVAPAVTLSGKWTVREATIALRMLGESGLSQRAFAERHGFPASRIPSWRKRLEVAPSA